MNGKQKSTYLLASVAVLTGIIGIGGYLIGQNPKTSDRLYLKNAGGAVLFEHQQHAKMVGDCANCHHEVLLSDERTQCTECHDEGMDAADFVHADFLEVGAHSCTTCHQVNADIKPQSCANCHPKSQDAEAAGVECANCHDDSYQPGDVTHDELQEIEGHSCEGCHNIRAVSDVYHSQCNRCHLSESREMFVDADGKTRCAVCHLK